MDYLRTPLESIYFMSAPGVHLSGWTFWTPYKARPGLRTDSPGVHGLCTSPDSVRTLYGLHTKPVLDTGADFRAYIVHGLRQSPYGVRDGLCTEFVRSPHRVQKVHPDRRTPGADLKSMDSVWTPARKSARVHGLRQSPEKVRMQSGGVRTDF